jgi:hypothetical protein
MIINEETTECASCPQILKGRTDKGGPIPTVRPPTDNMDRTNSNNSDFG